MQAVLFSLLATIVGTLIGSLVAVCARNRSPKIINYLLSLAAGVMLSLVEGHVVYVNNQFFMSRSERP